MNSRKIAAAGRTPILIKMAGLIATMFLISCGGGSAEQVADPIESVVTLASKSTSNDANSVGGALKNDKAVVNKGNNSKGDKPKGDEPPVVAPPPIVIAPIVVPPPVVIAPIVVPPPVVIAPIVEPPPVVVIPPPVVVPPPVPYTFTGYQVTGNTIFDKSSGKPHLFRGVASPSMAWQVRCDHCTLDQFQLMKQGWNANVVRLSVGQKFWLTSSAHYNAAYAPEIARVVAAIKQAGMDVILDNHGSSSPHMADADSVIFWKEVATAYKNDPHVLFELFNEPNKISWDVWLNGGTAPSGPPVRGMQELYNTVRSTGATNLVVIGGLNWAYDLSGVPTHRVVGNNIVYNTHPYNYPGKQPSDWDRGFGFLAKTDPVISTEFGNFDCTKPYYQSFVDYAKANKISWTAWAWFPGGCGFPAIVTDWNGTPNAQGQVIKDALMNP